MAAKLRKPKTNLYGRVGQWHKHLKVKEKKEKRKKIRAVVFRAIVSQWHGKQIYDISKARNITMIKLITIAIYNELRRPNPFEFQNVWPGKFIKGQYGEQAEQLLRRIRRYGRHGTSLDWLILCYKDIGFDSPEMVYWAYTELINSPYVEIIDPFNKLYKYKKGTKYVRAVKGVKG